MYLRVTFVFLFLLYSCTCIQNRCHGPHVDATVGSLWIRESLAMVPFLFLFPIFRCFGETQKTTDFRFSSAPRDPATLERLTHPIMCTFHCDWCTRRRANYSRLPDSAPAARSSEEPKAMQKSTLSTTPNLQQNYLHTSICTHSPHHLIWSWWAPYFTLLYLNLPWPNLT